MGFKEWLYGKEEEETEEIEEEEEQSAQDLINEAGEDLKGKYPFEKYTPKDKAEVVYK